MSRNQVAVGLDEKRQILYASLLRYSSETLPLRERALNRVVLAALLGSSASDPFRLGRIQQNISFGSSPSTLRTEVVQETLDRLLAAEVVNHTLLKERHSYYLTPRGEAELGQATGSAQSLFTAAEQILFRDTTGFLPPDTASHVFRRFVFECFGRFGRLIGKNVTGDLTREELHRAVDHDAAFTTAVQGIDLTSEQRESIKVRCESFLLSAEPDAEALKFFLTQGYYITQLLGVDGSAFNPLAVEAFRGAVFFLDTNVLLSGAALGDEFTALFKEVVDLSRRLGVELVVTRATLSETRTVVADRIADIRRIRGIVPTAVAKRTKDQIAQAFFTELERTPNLTPEEFLRPLSELIDRVNVWPGLSVDERLEDDILGDRTLTEASAVIYEEALQGRGFPKSDPVLKHDVAHYALVMDERRGRQKTWFLTRDRTLLAAAARLCGSNAPFCFSLLGFLQSISPFITTASEQRSFAEVFSAFLKDQVQPRHQLFEIRELVLMAEFHEDVMSTAPEQLVVALDYVKSHTLQGRTYRAEDIPKVSLELRKFLATSKDEQLRAVKAEAARLAGEASEERRSRTAAERSLLEATADKGRLEAELARTLSDTAEQVAVLQRTVERQEGVALREVQKRWGMGAVVGIAMGIGIWRTTPKIADALIIAVPALDRSAVMVTILVAGFTVFLVPTIVLLRYMRIREGVRTALLTVSAAMAFYLSRLISPEDLNVAANVLGVAAFVALMVGNLVWPRKGNHEP
jgi:hypothetical protein